MAFKLCSAQNCWPFVPLSNLHNPFSESSAKTMHTTCENKQRYKWKQCVPNYPPKSHLSLFSASVLIRLLSRTIYSLTYNMVNVFSRSWVYWRKKSSAQMISICSRRLRCALQQKRSKPRSSRWTWMPKSTVLFYSNRNLELCLLSNRLCCRASDLVMKVDALLTAAPKGEARKDVKLLKDKHRSVLRQRFFWYWLILQEYKY